MRELGKLTGGGRGKDENRGAYQELYEPKHKFE